MKSCTGVRIGVLMLNSPNIPKYAHLAAVVNYMYTAQHGYTFIVERCPHTEDMDKPWMWDENNEYVFVWSKPTLVAKHLPDYDYLLYIDSDAVFVDFTKSIESFTHEHMQDPEVCIVAAADCESTKKCWDADAVNAGVMLFRNSPTTLALLEEWTNAAMTPECSEWKFKHPREQQCLNILRTSRYIQNIKKLPVEIMGGQDGTWVRHLVAMNTADRQKLMAGYVNAHLAPHWEGFEGPICNRGLSTVFHIILIGIMGLCLGVLVGIHAKLRI